MTQRTVLHTRPAPQRRPRVRDGSSRRVPLALVVLSLIPVIAGSLRLLEVAGGPLLLPTNPRIDASPAPPGGDLLWGVRLLVGSAIGAGILLGFTAIRRGDIAAHRAWMIRAYALAVGAGTQAFTQGIGEAPFGTGDLSIALSVSAGWVINATVAEWAIRRPDARRAGRARTRAASAGS